MAGERRAYSTTQLFGLGLMATAMILVTILTYLLIDTEDSYWPVAAVATVVAIVAWRFDGLWAKILGLLGTFAVGGSVFFLVFGIFQPFSPFEFILGLMFVVGFLTSLGGGIMTLAVGGKREPGPSARGRGFRRVALGFIGVASIVSVVGFLLTRTTVTEAEAQGKAPVEMTNFEFAPETVSVASGQSLLLENEDAFAHDFTLDEFDIDVAVGPGSDAVVDVSSIPPGTYEFYCSLHTDPATGEGMTGQLVVEG